MTFKAQSMIFMLVVFSFVMLGREGGETSGITAVDTVAATSLIAKQEARQSPEPRSAPLTPVVFENPDAAVGRFIGFAEPEKIGAANINPPPSFGAAAVSVYDLSAERTLLERESERRWPIASITKLMTAAISFETLAPDTKVVITERAVATEGRAGNLAVGEIFRAEDLIRIMLMTSSNDAAVALSGAVNYDAFIDKMRIKSFDLKMSGATFADPTGLSVLNQAKASDLKKLIIYISEKHPKILEITAQPTAEVTDLKSGAKRLIISTNRFAGEKDFLGGKTGYTDESNGNLLSLFRHNGKKILIIIFGSKDRFGDTEKLLGWVKKNF